MAYLDRNGELAFGDDPDNATVELVRLRAQVAALTVERDEARLAVEVAAKEINDAKNAMLRAEAAEAKAAQFERDWYAAKSEFGEAMGKSRAATRAAEAANVGLRSLLSRLYAEKDPK